MDNSNRQGAGVGSDKIAHNRVGISLMVSSDTEAIIEVTRQRYPDAKNRFPRMLL